MHEYIELTIVCAPNFVPKVHSLRKWSHINDDSVRSGRSMRRQIEDMDICGLMTQSGNGSDFIVLKPACSAWISRMVLVPNQYGFAALPQK